MIDVHAHLCPLPFIDQAEKRMNPPYPLRIARLLDRLPSMTDPEMRLRAMDEQDIEKSILSLAAVNIWPWNPQKAVELSRIANETLKEVCNRYPERFLALGTVPLESPMEAAKELEYTVVTLGFPGVMVGANIQGQPLDEQVFTDFWETADRLGAIVFIHPAEIHGITSLNNFGLRPVLGYLFDTSIAVARLALSGHLELYPHVHIIIPHLGGVLPFVLNRLDRGYEIHEETRHIEVHAPSHYLTNGNVYYDTVSLHRPALLATLETVGVQQLLFGSDSPHTTGGTPEEICSALKSLGLSPEEELLVLKGNANNLFKL